VVFASCHGACSAHYVRFRIKDDWEQIPRNRRRVVPAKGIPGVQSYAAIPHLINYQGKLTDSSGTSLNGSYNITFRLYDAETAGNLLWQETQTGVLVQKGVFSILLGSVTALNLPFDKQYYLAIQVGTDAEMSPRQRITSAGYAFRAEESEKLGGKQSSEYALATDITDTPTANKTVKLDSNAKLPVSALKVYDSGWFAVTTATTYTKTHNLGTTKVLIQIWYSTSSNGSNAIKIDQNAGGAHDGYTVSVINLTTTSLGLQTGASNVCVYFNSSGNEAYYASGYYRIIMLGLE